MENGVIKKINYIVLLACLLVMQFAVASDEMFNKMEAGGAFEKIRANMIASCYIRKDEVPPKIDIKSLQSYFPDRVTGCNCFEKELKQVSNRKIFDDSRRAYQLHKAKVMAMQSNDPAKIKEATEKQNNFKPFMSIITEKCSIK